MDLYCRQMFLAFVSHEGMLCPFSEHHAVHALTHAHGASLVAHLLGLSPFLSAYPQAQHGVSHAVHAACLTHLGGHQALPQ